MSPGTTMNLVKQITARCGGMLASYKLGPQAVVPVLVLRQAQPNLTDQIAAIDEAAETAKAQLRIAYNVQRAGAPLVKG